MSGCYAISPSVIHEAFDDEVVIANLEVGSYYSLAGSGMAVWSGIECGLVLECIVDEIATVTGADRAVVAEEAQKLVDDLLAEELVEELDVATAEEPSRPFDVPVGEFIPPTFQKYTDMQQLLLLDPIHDVDDAGWPVPRDQP